MPDETPLEQMRAFMRTIPFNVHLGIEVDEASVDGIAISCLVRPEFLNGHGVLHGGVLATLADVAVGVALKPHIAPATATTIDLKMNYLRPISQGRVHARATLVKIGRTLITGRVDLTDSQGRLAAIGLATYMVLEDQATRTTQALTPQPPQRE